jgi:hypothetical protein
MVHSTRSRKWSSIPVACTWSVVLSGYSASSTSKAGLRDIAEILLKVASTTNQNQINILCCFFCPFELPHWLQRLISYVFVLKIPHYVITEKHIFLKHTLFFADFVYCPINLVFNTFNKFNNLFWRVLTWCLFIF